MKCPQCGHWNRDSLPRCFRCGAELNASAQPASTWQETMRREQQQKVYIRIDDEGRSTAETDARETLAREMNKLQERKERGKARQRTLREEGARQGLAPSGRSVENYTSRGSFYSQAQDTHYISQDGQEVEGDVRPDATEVKSTMFRFDYGDDSDLPPPTDEIYMQHRNRRTAQVSEQHIQVP